MKKRISISKYVAAFSISLLIIVLGIILGQTIANEKFNEISSELERTKSYILGLDLQSKLLTDENLCKVDVFDLTKDKVYAGRQVSYLENVLGKNDKNVLQIKENYLLLSLDQYLLVKKVSEICDKKINIIIFFYSNNYNYTESENQGHVLDYIYDKYPESTVVYAFDVDIDNPALNVFKTLNDVQIVPTVIINDIKYEDFRSRKNIESLLS